MQREAGRPHRVALVVPGLSEGGGVPNSAVFIRHTLESTGRYEPAYVSLPMGSHAPHSLRLTRPSTWRAGAQVSEGEWGGQPYVEVGAVGSEVEILRMRARPALTAVLNTFDLVHVVAGAPAWATVAAGVRPPVLLLAATLIDVEREARLRTGKGPRNVWRMAMTRVGSRMDVTALSGVRAAFSINEWMRDWMAARMPPGTVHLAPPGVDIDRFKPSRHPAPAHILAVGRFHDPRKNVRLLFEAYARLRSHVPAAPCLVLAGATEPSPSDWEVARSLGIRPHVTMHTGVSEEALAELYRGASLFVLSSDEEGLGIVLLEAMASGVPVVSTSCGGPSTCVVDGVNGYLTPVGDADALAERMALLLLDEPARKEMGARAREHVVAHFSLAAAGRVFVQVYDDVVRTPVLPRP